MRRSTTIRGAVAGALILVLGLGGLAACSGDGAGDPTGTPAPTAAATAPSDADIAALAAVTVEGDAGAAPTITLPSTPFTVTANVARVLDEGDGDEVEAGQLLALHSTWVSGTDGSAIGSTFDAGKPEAITLDENQLPAALFDVIAGHKVGTRALVALAGTDSATVIVVEVAGAQDLPSRAEGTAVTPPAELPAVTLDDTGAPSLAAAAGDPPADLVVQPLIQGAGPAVEAGQTVIVKYTGWLWDGTQFDSSWDSGTSYPVVNVGQAQVIDGWNQGLVGATVGSQLLLVIPPDLGYGDQVKGSIPANSTLVFVVDVLAAV